ncbi:MAG: response regulator [Verrucomicrobiia bacterium]
MPKAIITQIKASGAVVKLIGPAEEQDAWLPGHEMYADFHLHQDFRERAQDLLGKEIEVVELGSAFGQRQKLVSHVRVANDPWNAVASWKDGEIKVMEVTAVTKGRAIGLIRPGIRAEVDLEGLEDLLPSSWGNFARPIIGDEVAGFFCLRNADAEKRVVVLDVSGYVRSPVALADAVASVDTAAAIEAVAPAEHLLEFDSSLHQDPPVEDINRILFVDDDKCLLTAISKFLTSMGCTVVACGTEEEATSAIRNREEDFDLAVIDVELRDRSKLEGLHVAQTFRDEQPNCPIVIVTGLDLDRKSPSLTNATFPVSKVITKPFGYEELHQALASVGEQPRPLLDMLPGGPRSHAEQACDLGHPGEYDEIQCLVNVLRQTIRAEAVVLFSVHPVSYTVQMVAKSDPESLFRSVKPRVGESPLADVAIKQQTVQAKDAKARGEHRRHRFLQEAYGYRSCVGVPVKLGLGATHGYALFAFHRHPSSFDASHKWEVEGVATQMGYLLRIAFLTEELRQVKSFAMMGQVYGSMAHDLSNALSFDITVRNLTNSLADGQGIDNPDVAGALNNLERNATRAASIVRTFRDMARGTLAESTEFPIAQELAAIAQRFSAEAQNYSVEVRMLPYTEPECFTKMRRSGFEQVLYNLLLNAAQQIHRLDTLRPSCREIAIELRYRTEANDEQWADIFVHDNGPGIHKRDFKRVFDMHYTTKRDGCGMGLDIARTIVEDVRLNGQQGGIRIRRSILLVGTTIEVNIPVRRA